MVACALVMTGFTGGRWLDYRHDHAVHSNDTDIAGPDRHLGDKYMRLNRFRVHHLFITAPSSRR